MSDDTIVTLRPLPIGRLRKFNNEWKQFGKLLEAAVEKEEVIDENAAMDIYIRCVGIALEPELTAKFDSIAPTAVESKKGEIFSAEYKNYLEDVIDVQTVSRVLEVCGGLQMTRDENLIPTETEI